MRKAINYLLCFVVWTIPSGCDAILLDDDNILLGFGYNALKGNPYEHPDPGLLVDKSIIQGDVSNKDYDEHCLTRTSLIHGSLSLQNHFKLIANGSVMDLDGKSFTLNQGFQDRVSELKGGERVKKDIVTTCPTERLQIGYDALHTDFTSALCALPDDYDDEYLNFIDTWGTHAVVAVEIGDMRVESYDYTLQQLFTLARNQAPGLLEEAGPLYEYRSSVILNASEVLSNSKMRNDHPGSPRTTNDQHVVIKLELASLPTVFVLEILNVILTTKGLSIDCTEKIDNVNRAWREYMGSSTTRATNDFPLQMPLVWPHGNFSLVEAADYGCPGDAHTLMVEGYRFFDTENDATNNVFSANVETYLKDPKETVTISGTGTSVVHLGIKLYFCTAIRTHASAYDLPWPKGDYCIMRYGDNCPDTGFREGSIHWDNEDSGNTNEAIGTLPSGVYSHDTLINFCCRYDGSASTAVALPTSKPFVLIKHRENSGCQSVQNMVATQVFVRWDDEDNDNINRVVGSAPFAGGEARNHGLTFCHYR